MSKWLDFGPPVPSQSGKTLIWVINAKEDGAFLGSIKWFGRWRRYVFHPAAESVFEQDCLRDIATFCEQRTNDHRRR